MAGTNCQLLIIILGVISQVVLPVSAAVDATLQPKANGVDVVRATIRKIHNSCIFPNDFGFLLRIALVESNFGQDSNTFRSDAASGGKGIWQIDRIGFDDTKLVSSAILTKVKEKFNIDWASMTYESANMDVPLYNALTARLLLYRKPAAIPPGVEAQAAYWKKYYNTNLGSGTEAGFISKVNGLNICDSVGADLLFILDGSGSIGSINFAQMKQVVIAVADKLKIGPAASQIAVLSFSSSIGSRIDFGNYSTLASLTTAVNSITYSGGGTNTHLALNLVGSMFQFARALDKGFPRVVVVLTDGASNSPTATQVAAQSLNAFSWLERYAVGMGSGIVNSELQTIASGCSRVYLISSVSEISAFADDLYDFACRSSVSLPEMGSGGYATISGVLAPGNRRNVRDTSVSRSTGRTYGLKLTAGSAWLYVSLSMENPSSAINDYSAKAKPQSPGVVFVSSVDLTGGILRTKREANSTNSTTSSSALYLSIVPDADSGSVSYQLEAYDGDRRSIYGNSGTGNCGIFAWTILAAMVSIATALLTH